MMCTLVYVLKVMMVLSLVRNVNFSQAGLDNSKSSTAPADPLAPLPSAMEGNSRQVTSIYTGSNPAKSYRVGLGSVELSGRDGRVIKWHREAGEKESVFRRRHKRRGEVRSLPSPSQPRLEHINISAVLIGWTYPFSDVPPPIQFTVQMEKDATLYMNISELLNDTNYIYSGMKLGGRYQFRVIANRYGQSSDPSEPSYVFTNGETAPSGPPINLLARTLSYTSIELSWDPPDGSFGLLYKIYASTDPQTLEQITDPVLGETHKTIDTLSPGTSYYFALRSDFAGHVSVLSAIVMATTNDPYLPPLTVTVLSVSTTWVWLTWSDPSPQRYPLKLNSFTIYYTADDTWVPSPIPDSSSVPDQFWNVTVGPASRYGNLTDLRPSTVYLVLVGYTAGEYWSELSQTQSVTTLEGVVCTFCEPLSSTELLIKWMTYSNDTRDRTFQVFEEFGGDTHWQKIATINTTSSITEYTVTRLHPWTGYTFLIATDGSGSGASPPDQSDQCPIERCWTLEAAPSAPPVNIQFSSVSSRQITLSWLPVPTDAQNGILRDYVIVNECAPRGDWQKCGTTQSVVDANVLTKVFEGLTPFTEYTFEIAAENQAGRGPLSLPLTVTTLEEEPSGPPTDLSVLNTSAHTAFLLWDPPLPPEQNGVITGYTLRLSHSSIHHSQERSFRKGPTPFEGNYREVPVRTGSPSSVELSSNSTIAVNVTWTEVCQLRPSTLYSFSVAAKTSAGTGPESIPLEFWTLVDVVYTSLEMNLTAKANIATDQIPHNCFTIVFSWTLPRTAGNSSQTTNLSLQYSDSDNHTGKIILDSDTNTYVLNSSAHYLQSTTRYTFWLVLVLDLQNGTVEHVTSFPTDVTTPSCSDSGDSTEGESRLWVIVLVCSLVAVVLAALCCVPVYCLRRALRRHRQPQGMLMDSDQAPAVEELFLDLRRSDGQSDSSSSSSEAFVENRGTSPPRLSPPVSTQQSTDSECDSVDSSTCEKTLLLQTTRKTHMEIGTNDRDEPTASGHQVLCHQEWPLDLSQVDISTVPRGLPEGCSESSSSSDCSLLTDM